MSGFKWLIMILEKDDAQIIDINSKMWGSLSYVEEVKRTEGTQAMLLTDGRLRSYMILKQGADDFSEDLAERKKQIKVPETDHRAQLTEADETASTASKKFLRCAIVFKNGPGNLCLGMFKPPENRLN